MSRLRSLDALVASGLCAGCGLCAAMVPSVAMRISVRGFARPAVGDLSETELARVLAVCPGANLDGPPAAPSTHAVWGPMQALHRAWATDPGVRHAGASGGVITALCTHLLATGAVDAVLHVGSEAHAPLRTVPRVSTTAAQLVDRAGSRYAPSPVLAGLDDALARHGRIAVVGKPCDIAALRRHVATDPSLPTRIPWMLSFFCAGVPSLVGTEILVRRMGLDPATLTGLRYRGRGWPGRMAATTADGRTASMSYTDSWGGELHRHLQFRCKICPDGTGEHADIAAADAWLTCDGYPDFAERDGISAVLARTEHGAALLAAAVAAGAIQTAPLLPAELMAMQPYQVRRKRVLLGRLAALRLLGQRLPRYRELRLWRNALRGGRALLRDLAGTGLRVLQGRHRE
ncbi:coenzyme F420 hydrogenase subunit beta [Constrictibacter sp. MBR-5]|jgi:coenzyme F420 hydrogenase subunit beta|uniref:Coenzyme F420 hydrogenase/dehydrogenase, beta subunit C-terminal domain n=1 Tax=Constrictibacter sp. MBR-5 TaxID=3156467 RepID=UPI0033949D78